MAALLDVALRTAESPDQEIAQPLLRTGQVVFRIHRPEHRVVWYLAVEFSDKTCKTFLANRSVDRSVIHQRLPSDLSFASVTGRLASARRAASCSASFFALPE